MGNGGNGVMNFEEADALAREIEAFLLSCGGIYQKITNRLEAVILTSIATGQHILYRDEAGAITHWLAYWKIQPEDIEDIKEIQPADTTTGSVLYIVDHGNKDGRKGMTQMIKELRRRSTKKQVVVWNSKGRGIRVFTQKGA